MKQSELKKILKPLIKQCIKEVIFEEGVLSGLISEVVQGLGSQQMIVETKQKAPPQETRDDFSRAPVEPDPEFLASLQESKRKLEDSMGTQFKGILNETAPLSRGGTVGGNSNTQGPLSNFAPDDPGVDISGLLALGGKNWKHMI
tara:strand:- start:124 stop:558 length:435 start_codon:yes stop_codon:yes gene_type:complete